MTSETGGTKLSRLPHAAIRIGVLLIAAYALHLVIDWARSAGQEPHGTMQIGVIILLILTYAVLITIPFVPGLELGLTMMVVEGPWITPFVYLATVAGLSLSFCLGQWLPYRWLERGLEVLRLRRGQQLVAAFGPLDRNARLELLKNRGPSWVGVYLARFRYVLVAALLNLPGNSVIGGGGGVCMLAGLSHLFHPVATFLTISLAVAPVPLAVWLFGFDPLN